MKRFVIFIIFLVSTSLANADTLVISGKLIDSILGLSGDYCVSKDSNVGDVFTNSHGNTATVRSIDWFSYGCQYEKNNPVRAELDLFISEPRVKLNIPDDIPPTKLSDLARFNGQLFFSQTGLLSQYRVSISSYKRPAIQDFQKFLDDKELRLATEEVDVKNKSNETLTRGKLKLYIREISGVPKCVICRNENIFFTAIADAGEDDLILLSAVLGDVDKYKKIEKDRLIGILTSTEWLKSSEPNQKVQVVKSLDNSKNSKKEKSEESFEHFLFGEIDLSCKQKICSNFYNAQLEKIKQAYAKGEWYKLLAIIQACNYPVDVNYYYLGKVAEELKFNQAAVIYYNKALTLYSSENRCALMTQCNGIDVQADSQSGLNRLKEN